MLIGLIEPAYGGLWLLVVVVVGSVGGVVMIEEWSWGVLKGQGKSGGLEI